MATKKKSKTKKKIAKKITPKPKKQSKKSTKKPEFEKAELCDRGTDCHDRNRGICRSLWTL